MTWPFVLVRLRLWWLVDQRVKRNYQKGSAVGDELRCQLPVATSFALHCGNILDSDTRRIYKPTVTETAVPHKEYHL